MARPYSAALSFTLRHLADNIGRATLRFGCSGRSCGPTRRFVICSTRCTEASRLATCSSGRPGAELGARQIGTDAKEARVARWLIVDGSSG